MTGGYQPVSSAHAALNTLRAGKWTLRFAKWFGEHITRTEREGKVTLAKWGNRWYLIDFDGCACVDAPETHCRSCGH